MSKSFASPRPRQLAIASLETPLGPVHVAVSDRGLCSLSWGCAPEAFRDELAQAWPELAVSAGLLPASDPRRQRCQEALEAFCRAEAWQPSPELPLDLSRLTAFQRAVLAKTAQIPPGEVRPYEWVAREIGHPQAARAVGNALAANPIPLLIPCHRVVAKNGHIGRYTGGGPAAKARLLELEGVDVRWLAQLAAQRIRLVARPALGTFCYPTCRLGGRGPVAAPPGEPPVGFLTPEAALAAGYRPCPCCRPA